jgi:HEAT repeat protein
LQAALALSLLGRESTAAISALLVAVMDNVWDGRNQVLDALVATNPLPGQGLEILLELVRHDEQLGPAVNGLARLAIGNAGALNALCELLLDESAPPAQRRATAEVLGVYKLGSGMVVSALVRALEAGDCSLRFAAVDSLGKLEPHEEAVVKALTNRLHEDVEATLRRRAAYVLGQIGTASAVRALREALGDEDLDVRRAAESALQRLEDI